MILFLKLKNKEIVIIPNPIDTTIFRPINKKKARKALKRKDAKQIQTTSTRQAQGDVVPKSIMKQKGAAGMIKRKMYKKMKKAMIDRKKVVKARTIKRGEASRVKAARASYFGKKK